MGHRHSRPCSRQRQICGPNRKEEESQSALYQGECKHNIGGSPKPKAERGAPVLLLSCRRLTAGLILLLPLLLSLNCDTATKSTPRPVFRKGVTLAGDLTTFTNHNFDGLQQILNTGAGVIGVNLPWNAATADCSSGCVARKPSNPRYWNDPQYANSPAVQMLDAITNHVAQNGGGAFVMGITWGTPGWATCAGDSTDPHQQPFYPPQNAADYGDFMYAMSERYNGTHLNDSGVAIGKVRDWVVYNEVNSPQWWRNTACNTQGNDPVYYYGVMLNQAYTAVHHLPASASVRVLAGAFAAYDRKDYQGDPGLRISTDYMDWATNTANNDLNNAWISPTDFVEAMHNYGDQFDAVALHPYPPTMYGDPLAQPPDGAISLGNLGMLVSQLRKLYPKGQTRQWHVALTEYMQQSYYAPEDSWDHVSAIPCPNYFCAQTTEANLNFNIQAAYGIRGSNQPYVDYLIWTMWNNVDPYVGGLVRADGTDKNEGLGRGSVRQTFTEIQP